VRGYRPLPVEPAGAALTVAALVAANLVTRPGPQSTIVIPVSPVALVGRS
jgi:hypothetical protein